MDQLAVVDGVLFSDGQRNLIQATHHSQQFNWPLLMIWTLIWQLDLQTRKGYHWQQILVCWTSKSSLQFKWETFFAKMHLLMSLWQESIKMYPLCLWGIQIGNTEHRLISNYKVQLFVPMCVEFVLKRVLTDLEQLRTWSWQGIWKARESQGGPWRL